jgi:hypothetical protein
MHRSKEFFLMGGWRKGSYEKVGPSSEAKRVQWKRLSSKAPDAGAELG